MQLAKHDPQIIEKLVLDGDLSKMSQPQKVTYYKQFCDALGLNSLTQPFQLINFQGKQRLYATKDCTEQLRKIHGVSITEVTSMRLDGVFVVTAKAQDKTGKTDASTGAVTIEGLKGDALANALMKAETKAKRRVTLSICGLGMLDESETDTMIGAEIKRIPTEEEVMWIDELSKCQTEEDMMRLYEGNRETVEATPWIKNLFSVRKKQLKSYEKVA